MSGTDFTTTPYYALYKPVAGMDVGTWGLHWNANADTIDSALKAHDDTLAAMDGAFLPLSGGTVTGTLNITMPGAGVQLAKFFTYGYGATAPAMHIQSAGSSIATTDFRSLVVSKQATHDDGPTGAQGILAASLTVDGKSRTDLYAMHALTYVRNLASDLTPLPGDGSSQHGGIAAQTVKQAPAGGIPVGKMGPDVFTHWWQTINETNRGSAASGADLCLEADVVCNGPDDYWKLGASVRTGNTTVGSPVITGISDTSVFVVGRHVNIVQGGDDYIMAVIVSTTANSITIDTNAVATITGTIMAPRGGIRFSFQNVLKLSKKPASGGTPLEWMYGHYQNNSSSPGDGVANWGVGFAYYGAYFVAASDYSLGQSVASPYSADGINRAVAIKLRADQKVAFNGDGFSGNYLQYRAATGRLYYVVGGVDKFSIDASGNVRAAGTITGSVTP